MPKVTVKTPFVARIGGEPVHIQKGQQDLSDDLVVHAKNNGFLDEAKPASAAKKEEHQNA